MVQRQLHTPAPAKRSQASTIERYILILCFYLRLIPYPCLYPILSLIRLDLLASFKRRLDSLAFACNVQASLGFACIRLQCSSVAWIRLHSLANFKRRLLLLAFACKFQASLGCACIRLQVSSVAWMRLRSLASFKRRLDALAFACKFQASLGFACKFQASLFRHDCCCMRSIFIHMLFHSK